jgi:hypothetical protein
MECEKSSKKILKINGQTFFYPRDFGYIRSIAMEKRTYTSVYGNIDYTYIKNVKYPDGLVVLDGAIVHKEYRGKGKFKTMLKALLNEYPEGMAIQAAVITNKLTSMFERMGMVRVKSIEVWGSPANCKLLQGKLNKSSLENI